MHPDSPIKRPDEDALRRTDFANGIADSISAFGPSDSVVLGIVGPWGSGKSSLINLIVNRLDELGAGSTLIVRFNPWRYSGSDQLFSLFFSVLAQAISASDKVETLRKATERMKQASFVLEKLKVIPLLGHALGAIGELAKAGAQNTGALLADVDSLDALHAELAKELTEKRVRILVIIDDIDRLSQGEILQIFQLVKSLADFPYVMYLLAYDESVVLRAIDPSAEVARNYLEKIVNVPIDVPPPYASVVTNLLLQNIFALLRPKLPPFFDEERMLKTLVNGYRTYFRTLRDVARFSNLFAFNYARVGQKVDVGDLAAITALQIFEHELYEAMARAPSTLIDSMEAVWRQDHKNPKETRERIEALIAQASCACPEAATELLRELFPKADAVFRGHSYGLSSGRDSAKARVSSPDHFHLYFNMGIAPENVSDDEYRQAIELATTEDADIIKFLATIGIDKIGDMIARVRDDKSLSSLPRHRRIALVKSLFLIGDRFARDAPNGILSVPFEWRVGYAVSGVLEGDGDESYEVLLEAIREVKHAISSTISDVDLREKLLAKEGSAIPALSAERIEMLKNVIIEKVRLALDDGQIYHEYYLARVVYALDDWGVGDLVDRLAEEIRKSSDLLISYVNSLRQRGGFEGILKRRPMFFSLQNVDRIFPPQDLTIRIEELFKAGYGTEEQQNIMRDFIAQQRKPVDADDPFDAIHTRG